MSSRNWERLLGEAVAHQRTGDAAAAQRVARQAVELTIDPAPARLLGLLLAEAGDMAGLGWVQRALAADPHAAASHAALGRVLLLQQRWAEAEAAFTAALAREPGLAAAQGGREHAVRGYAAALARAGDAEAAAGAAAALPGCGPIHHAWGQVLFRARRWAEAAEALAAAAALLPSDASVLHDLGAARHEAGRLDEAADAYRRALALDPARVPSWHNLGSLLQRQGDMAGAMRAFGHAYALDRGAFGRIAQELAAGNPGRIWLRAETLRRDLLAAAG